MSVLTEKSKISHMWTTRWGFKETNNSRTKMFWTTYLKYFTSKLILLNVLKVSWCKVKKRDPYHSKKCFQAPLSKRWHWILILKCYRDIVRTSDFSIKVYSNQGLEKYLYWNKVSQTVFTTLHTTLYFLLHTLNQHDNSATLCSHEITLTEIWQEIIFLEILENSSEILVKLQTETFQLY